MKLLSKKSLLIGLPISVMLLTTSCKKDTVEPEEETPAPSGPTYNIPTTYNFTSADFTSSTQRLAQG
jgi:hypothetical protein